MTGLWTNMKKYWIIYTLSPVKIYPFLFNLLYLWKKGFWFDLMYSRKSLLQKGRQQVPHVALQNKTLQYMNVLYITLNRGCFFQTAVDYHVWIVKRWGSATSKARLWRYSQNTSLTITFDGLMCFWIYVRIRKI